MTNCKRHGDAQLWDNMRVATEKTIKYLSHVSPSPGQELNPGPPKYEVGVLTTQPRLSVIRFGHEDNIKMYLKEVCGLD
jgi:hypothetical protein